MNQTLSDIRRFDDKLSEDQDIFNSAAGEFLSPSELSVLLQECEHK